MLTVKQSAALNTIKVFAQENHRLPTLEEIGNELNIGRSTVHKHIRSLIKGGYLLESTGKAAYRFHNNLNSEDTLPYMGRIAAGAPIEAIPEQQNINLAKVFCGPDRYVLRISGDSMIEAGIWDEDYVVIQKQNYAQEGAIIVALINRYEATLKYYHPKDTGVTELRPANSLLKPMFYPSDNIEIQGVLVGVFRDYLGG